MSMFPTELDTLITEELARELQHQLENATHILRIYQSRYHFKRRHDSGIAYFTDLDEALNFSNGVEVEHGSILEVTECHSNVTYLIQK